MATEKLYWSDPFAATFSGARARAGTWAGERGSRTTVVLDRTLFYPESGGQMADTGTLSVGGRTLHVQDVQIDDAGAIHHLVAEPLEDFEGEADSVAGAIDAARRFDHMAQHTAQHALSRALVEVAGVETISARLGAGGCTLDVDGTLEERDVTRAEDLVNSLVTSDVTVRQLFPTAAELTRMPLRKAPSVDRDVRVIEIEGFDWTPCGGTHCTRTGQIGLIRVVGVEKCALRARENQNKRPGLRVTFHAGRRALDDVRAKEAVLAALARDFTCGPLDVGAAVGKLRASLKARSDLLSTTRGELVELVAERELAAHPPDPSGMTRVVVVRQHGQHDDMSMLRALAGRLAARPDVVAFCACREGGLDVDSAPAASSGVDRLRPSAGSAWLLVVQRGTGASFDCGAWVKRMAAAHGGRGGGRPDRAEARFPGEVALTALAGA